MGLGQLQLLTPIAIVGAAVMFTILEKRFPYNPGQRTFREGFWLDLIGYGLIQSYVMALLLSAFIHYIDGQIGTSRLRLVSDWPLWLQVSFFVVLHDFNTYLIHRSQHSSRWLWRTHEAHHSCKDVDWLAGIRSHSVEIVLYETVKFVPVVLLGASAEVPLWRAIIDSTYGMFIHANLNWRLGPLLYVFNGPELHRWHHANNDPRAFGRNFGTKLALWDHLFGSVYNPPGKLAGDYGPEDPAFPQKGYWRQFFFCFRPLGQAIPQRQGSPAASPATDADPLSRF